MGSPPAPYRCARDLTPLTDAQMEYCAYCDAHLCAPCWDRYGHCLHPRCLAAYQDSRRLARTIAQEAKRGPSF